MNLFNHPQLDAVVSWFVRSLCAFVLAYLMIAFIKWEAFPFGPTGLRTLAVLSGALIFFTTGGDDD